MIEHLNNKSVSPTRVVIIGATGFVGNDLRRELSAAKVATVALSSADVDLSKPDCVEKLQQTIQETDSVVIISAITPDKGKDVATLMRNLQMGQHLAAFLTAGKCAHAVYISSDAVYADDANPVSEESCCDPSSFHGLMHLVRERMLADAAQKSKVPLLLLRPTAIYGAGDTHNSYGPNRFVRTALNEGQIKLFGEGEEKRDHLYIKDLSAITRRALERRSRGVLNVAAGKSVSFFELAEAVARLSGKDIKIEGSPRVNPVTHRHFNITSIYHAFPDFKVTDLEHGLSRAWEETQRDAK
jgi:nucleoside-diphosphate-sugar epimerase